MNQYVVNMVDYQLNLRLSQMMPGGGMPVATGNYDGGRTNVMIQNASGLIEAASIPNSINAEWMMGGNVIGVMGSTPIYNIGSGVGVAMRGPNARGRGGGDDDVRQQLASLAAQVEALARTVEALAGNGNAAGNRTNANGTGNQVNVETQRLNNWNNFYNIRRKALGVAGKRLKKELRDIIDNGFAYPDENNDDEKKNTEMDGALADLMTKLQSVNSSRDVNNAIKSWRRENR
jgi:hypothetical protein